jgi:hypothetical protein
MNVFEFIKEKRSGIKDNTEQYRAILEPKFRSLSNKINNKIINTLNNPWMSNFKSMDGSNIFTQKDNIPNAIIKKAFDNIYQRLGAEIFIGEWETIDQECINNFADVTGDKQWIHINPEKAKVESPFKSSADS